ncbi:hypothetical protein V8C42DRAFT_243994 [Trichoderma barbatum]
MFATHIMNLLLMSAVGLRCCLADQTDAQKHLQVVPTGRAALDNARAKVHGNDTFTTYQKPEDNVVLIQEFNATTNDRLYGVALIDDQEAEYYYDQFVQNDLGGNKKCSTDCHKDYECESAANVGSGCSIYTLVSRCSQFCGRGYDCVDVRCPRCVYVGGNCLWQLRCRPTDGL